MPFNLHDFAAKLKKRRADLDLSPEALAEETGISVESLRAVEDAARPGYRSTPASSSSNPA